jgi:hypothetical protein
MSNLYLDPAFYPLLFFHCSIGGIATLIAKQKGYNQWLWLLFGLIGGTVAFMVIISMKAKDSQPNKTQ